MGIGKGKLMKTKWYRSTPVKSVWIVMEHLAIAALAVCFGLMVCMADKGILLWKSGDNDYMKSEKLMYEVMNASNGIVSGMSAQQMLLEENEERVVDLQEVADGTKLTYTNWSGLAYSVQDLVQWVQDGWNYGAGKNVVVCKTPQGNYEYYYYEEFQKMFEQENLQFVVDTDYCNMYGGTEREVIARVQGNLELGIMTDGFANMGIQFVEDSKGNVKYLDVWNFGIYVFEEKYAPVGAESILDVVNGDREWNGRLKEAYEALDSVLYKVSGSISNAELLNEYQEGKTNLTYFYMDMDTNARYTNRAAYEKGSYEKILEEIQAKSGYVILSSSQAECDTGLNVENMPLQYWKEHIEQYNFSENYIFAVQIDEEFPVKDQFAASKIEFDKFAKLEMPVMQVGGMALLFLVVGMVWLTLVAGRRSEDEELHLCAFDSWFTELSAGLIFGIWAVMMNMATNNSQITTDEVEPAAIFFAMLGLFTAAMFLTGYLSLVRRIKANSLWKDSFIRWFFRKCADALRFMAQNTRIKVKTLILGGAFMLFQFIVNAIIFSGGAVFMLALVLVDCLVLIFFMKKAEGCERIVDGLKRITDGELQHKISQTGLYDEQRVIADYVNRIGDGLDAAVENSLKNERMKTELITNVSHDIKTPLTSIINYVDLLKRENFTDPKVCGYLEVLEAKAQRLKVLTEDVVEASKASTGNITLEMVDLNFVEMVHQVIGEFEEKFQEHHLTMMVHFAEENVVIRADGQRMWRVLENVFNNVVKYAMEGTRVYADVTLVENKVYFSLKNISAQPLNISADELTERFIRGDVSRNTEGSGLGLSIAKSLTELQGGEFQLYLDGDLFKVTIAFAKR